jgi:hypothetical protein
MSRRGVIGKKPPCGSMEVESSTSSSSSIGAHDHLNDVLGDEGARDGWGSVLALCTDALMLRPGELRRRPPCDSTEVIEDNKPCGE